MFGRMSLTRVRRRGKVKERIRRLGAGVGGNMLRLGWLLLGWVFFDVGSRELAGILPSSWNLSCILPMLLDLREQPPRT